jgi:DNA-binding NtrC family response regulator
MNERLLIVDDETNMRWVLKEALGEAGYNVSTAGSGQEALVEMSESPADLVILDLKMKGMDGLATLQRLHERWPDVVVLILTAHGTVTTAVEAMQLGAADYLRKPFDVEEIRFKIHRALERQAMQGELQRLKDAARSIPTDVPTGTHPSWQRCIEQICSLTQLDLGVLLLGETGSGRATLARFAYGHSRRKAAPLIELDLSGIPPELQPAMVLGQDGSEGIWSRAGAGTLVLRNAEHVSQDMWSLLGERMRRGDPKVPRLLLTSTVVRTDAAALPLAQVEVPALRERQDDILLLARTFVPSVNLTAGALALLEGYTWPGNVTELRGVMERAATLASDDPIEERHLPERIRLAPLPGSPIRLPLEGLRLEEVEISLIRQALDRAGGNKTRAADLLGLTRQTLLYRCEKYGLTT